MAYTGEELEALMEVTPINSQGNVDYRLFLTEALENTMLMYEQKEIHIASSIFVSFCSILTSPADWAYLRGGDRFGNVWFNKRTGVFQRAV